LNSGVGTAKIARKDFSGDWEFGRGTIFERIELNDEKDFEMEFFSERFILDEFYGCYKPTPLKIILVLEIRLVSKEMGKLLQSIFAFPRSFFYPLSAPLHSANPYF